MKGDAPWIYNDGLDGLAKEKRVTGLPKTGEGLGQHARRGGVREEVTSGRALDVSTTRFSLLPRLMTVYVEE